MNFIICNKQHLRFLLIIHIKKLKIISIIHNVNHAQDSEYNKQIEMNIDVFKVHLT